MTAVPWARPVAALLVAGYLALVVVGWLVLLSAGAFSFYWRDSPPDAPRGGVITELVPGGAAQQAGIRPGDVMVAHDGRPMSERLNPGTGQRVVFAVQSPAAGGGYAPARDVAVVAGPMLSFPGNAFLATADAIVGLLFFAVGVGVFLAQPYDLAARLLLALGLSVALTLALRPVDLVVLDPSLVVGITDILAVLSGTVGLHLFLVFPIAPFAFARRHARLVYLLPAVMAAAVVLVPGVGQRWWTPYYSLLVLIGALLALVAGYVRAPTSIGRAQLRWIGWAMAVGVGVNALQLAGALSSLGVLQFGFTTAIWALVPLAVAFAILRYRLFDVRLVVRATVFYPLLTALLVAGYLFFAFGISRLATTLVGPDAAADATVSVLSALLVAALADPARVRLQRVLDRFVFRDRMARQLFVEEAAVTFGSAQPPEAVTAFLTEHAISRLNLSDAWVVPSDGGAVSGAASEPLLARLDGVDGVVALMPAEDAAGSGLSTIAADEPALVPWYAAGVRTVAPLRSAPGGTLLGAWLLGGRRSGEPFDRDDLAALGRVARQAAVLLDYDRVACQRAAEAAGNARLRRFFSPRVADSIARGDAGLAPHRRELTILFADLRGFTSLSETEQPETAFGMLNEFLAAMTQLVFAHGGTLDKYLGDGLMAFFGDPIEQEDHALRAVKAGIAMQLRMAELHDRWAARGRPRIAMGVGVSTGWVTAGTVGSEARNEYTVVGDDANVAARLTAAAAPGEVLMSETTWMLVRGVIQSAPRGEMELKGKSQPVPVYAATVSASELVLN